MARETLFHILSRQPWWVTLLVAIALFWIAYAIFPPVAPFVPLPFVLLATYFAFKQWGAGGPANLGERLTELRGLTWDAFSAAVTQAYRRQGYAVAPSDGRGYDFKLTKDGRTTLLQCRRWKMNPVGAAPVRELADAVQRNDAYRGVCLAAGEFSEPARKLARDEPVTLVGGAELVVLIDSGKRRWFRKLSG